MSTARSGRSGKRSGLRNGKPRSAQRLLIGAAGSILLRRWRDAGGTSRQQRGEPGPMPGAVDLGIADHGERAGPERAAQIPIALLADPAKLVLASARVLFRQEPQPRPDKSRPDRKALASATLATSAVASAGPTPGSSSSRRHVSFERCHAFICRSNSRI